MYSYSGSHIKSQGERERKDCLLIHHSNEQVAWSTSLVIKKICVCLGCHILGAIIQYPRKWMNSDTQTHTHTHYILYIYVYICIPTKGPNAGHMCAWGEGNLVSTFVLMECILCGKGIFFIFDAILSCGFKPHIHTHTHTHTQSTPYIVAVSKSFFCTLTTRPTGAKVARKLVCSLAEGLTVLWLLRPSSPFHAHFVIALFLGIL